MECEPDLDRVEVGRPMGWFRSLPGRIFISRSTCAMSAPPVQVQNKINSFGSSSPVRSGRGFVRATSICRIRAPSICRFKQPKHAGLGRPQYAGLGQPQYAGLGQPQYAELGQLQYAGLGQSQYAGLGQPQYAGLSNLNMPV